MKLWLSFALVLFCLSCLVASKCIDNECDFDYIDEDEDEENTPIDEETKETKPTETVTETKDSDDIKSITMKDVTFKVRRNQQGYGKYDFWDILYQWEPDLFALLKVFLNKESTFIDIGAWIGPLTLFGGNIAKHVYAIEPDQKAFGQLMENIALNPHLKEKISAHCICIDKETGFRQLGNLQNNPGDSTSSLLFAHIPSITKWTVPCFSFESYIDGNSILEVDFIKIDTEGAEAIILPSIKDWLELFDKPTLYVALHPPFYGGNLYRYAFEITEVFKKYTFLYITSTSSDGVAIKKVAPEEIYNKILEGGNILFSVLATETDLATFKTL